MAYEKTLWKTGDVVTQEKMNKIEQGIKSMELPTVTSEDNGKVLTVANGQWVLGDGGGSSDVFVVKGTYEDIDGQAAWTLDKTVSEIYAADNQGKVIVFMLDEWNDYKYILPRELYFGLSDEDEEPRILSFDYSYFKYYRLDNLLYFNIANMYLSMNEEDIGQPTYGKLLVSLTSKTITPFN